MSTVVDLTELFQWRVLKDVSLLNRGVGHCFGGALLSTTAVVRIMPESPHPRANLNSYNRLLVVRGRS